MRIIQITEDDLRSAEDAIQKLTDKYIKHPLDVLNIGDNVKVKVLGVDEKRNRI